MHENTISINIVRRSNFHEGEALSGRSPRDLTGGTDTRQKMGLPAFLVIEKNPDGVFLYRYDVNGKCVGDTWHMNVDDAKHQANYEYEGLMHDWHNVPAEAEGAVAFGLARLKGASSRDQG